MFFYKEFVNEMKTEPSFKKFNEFLFTQLFFSSNYNFYIKQITIKNFGEIQFLDYKKEHKNTLIKYSSNDLKYDFLSAIKWCLNQNIENEKEFLTKINYEKTCVKILVCTENENDKIIEKRFIFSNETNTFIPEILIDGSKYLFNMLLKGMKIVSNFGCLKNESINREIKKLDSKILNLVAKYFVTDSEKNISLFYDSKNELQWFNKFGNVYFNKNYSDSDKSILEFYDFLITQKIDADNQRLFIDIPQNIDEINYEIMLKNLLMFFPEHNIIFENISNNQMSKINKIVKDEDFDEVILI